MVWTVRLRGEDGVGLWRSLCSDAETVSRGGRRAVPPSRSSAKRERKTEKGHVGWYQFPNQGEKQVFLTFLHSEQFHQNSWRRKEGPGGEALAWLHHPVYPKNKAEAREVQTVAQGSHSVIPPRAPPRTPDSEFLSPDTSEPGVLAFPLLRFLRSEGHVTRACFLRASSFSQPPPAPAAVNPASCSPGGRGALRVPDGCVALPRVCAPSGLRYLQEPGWLRVEDPGQGTGGEHEGRWERGAEGPGAGGEVHGHWPSTSPADTSCPLCLQFWGAGGLTVAPLCYQQSRC